MEPQRIRELIKEAGFKIIWPDHPGASGVSGPRGWPNTPTEREKCEALVQLVMNELNK